MCCLFREPGQALLEVVGDVEFQKLSESRTDQHGLLSMLVRRRSGPQLDIIGRH